MNEEKNITVISFSSRANGNCARIARYICEKCGGAELFDFSGFEIHGCGGCGYECFAAREDCPYYGDMECRMLDAIVNSSLVYFVIPNYCDYPCSNFFVFNERSQCCFQGRPELLEAYEKVPKRSVIVSNTDEENFIKALSYHSDGAPDILFLSSKKYGKRSLDGDLLTSEEAKADIAAFVKGEQ
ncbi:MAG: hypothetical protein J6P98_03865 [Clostridia bacterium]|nr:hypothetical protein [Clostridia bacterium]